jgi:hypothetical protein
MRGYSARSRGSREPPAIGEPHCTPNSSRHASRAHRSQERCWDSSGPDFRGSPVPAAHGGQAATLRTAWVPPQGLGHGRTLTGSVGTVASAQTPTSPRVPGRYRRFVEECVERWCPRHRLNVSLHHLRTPDLDPLAGASIGGSANGVATALAPAASLTRRGPRSWPRLSAKRCNCGGGQLSSVAIWLGLG